MRPISKIQKERQREIKVLYMATLVLLLPIIASIYFLIGTPKDKVPVTEPIDIAKPLSINLNGVKTTAYSAIVVALNTKEVLYDKDSKRPLSLASITKLVTAKVAEDQPANEIISINKLQPTTYGDFRLTEGEAWKKDDLIAYTLLTSSNDGAHSLKESSNNKNAFIENMNSLVASIGLVNTKFYNETGLDDDERGIVASKGTAEDVSSLLSYLIKTDLPLYEKTKYSSASIPSLEGMTQAKNTNEVTDQIVGLLVSKTGYTDTAGGNLAVVADMGLNEPTAFVVLHSSKESRFDDVLNLQKEYFAQVAQKLR